MSDAAEEQEENPEVGSQEEDAPPEANSMAAFHEKMPELKEALGLLVIRNNASGRNKFREKWADVAAYIFGEKLIEYDNEGTQDREHRAELEDEAGIRRIELNTLLDDVVDKSVDKGILNTEYVGEVIDQYTVEVAQFVYAEDVIERVRPGKLATIKSRAEKTEEEQAQPTAPLEAEVAVPEEVEPIETQPAENAEAALQNPDTADMPMPHPAEELPTEVPEEKAAEVLETPVEEAQPEPIAAPDAVVPPPEPDLPSPGTGPAPEPEITTTQDEVEQAAPPAPEMPAPPSETVQEKPVEAQQPDVFAQAEPPKEQQADVFAAPEEKKEETKPPTATDQSNPFAAVLATQKPEEPEPAAAEEQKQDVFVETPAVQEMIEESKVEEVQQNQVQPDVFATSEPPQDVVEAPIQEEVASLSVSKSEAEAAAPLEQVQPKSEVPVAAPPTEPQTEKPQEQAQEKPKPAIFGMKKSDTPNPVQAPTAEPQRGQAGYYKTVFNMAAAKR